MKPILSLIIPAAILLAGCSSGAQPGGVTPEGTPSRAPAPAALTPYHSPTPRPSARAGGQTPTAIPTPTPTPRSYTVVRGDDLFGIALRHGVPLDLILTANPTVDPNFLSIGVTLQIPFAPITPTPGQATPTPVSVEVHPPDCYPTTDGGAWCFLTIRNPSAGSVENLSGRLVLSGGASDSLFSADAVPFLDALPAGQQMPLAGYFPEAPRPFAANGQLLSAVSVLPADTRYLPATVEDLQVQVRPDGLSALASGSASLASAEAGAARVWVLAVAYSSQGSVAGVRKIEINQPLAAGSRLPFELVLYSLGPAIERVEVLVEARP